MLGAQRAQLRRVTPTTFLRKDPQYSRFLQLLSDARISSDSSPPPPPTPSEISSEQNNNVGSGEKPNSDDWKLFNSFLMEMVTNAMSTPVTAVYASQKGSDLLMEARSDYKKLKHLIEELASENGDQAEKTDGTSETGTSPRSKENTPSDSDNLGFVGGEGTPSGFSESTQIGTCAVLLEHMVYGQRREINAYRVVFDELQRELETIRSPNIAENEAYQQQNEYLKRKLTRLTEEYNKQSKENQDLVAQIDRCKTRLSKRRRTTNFRSSEDASTRSPAPKDGTSESDNELEYLNSEKRVTEMPGLSESRELSPRNRRAPEYVSSTSGELSPRNRKVATDLASSNELSPRSRKVATEPGSPRSIEQSPRSRKTTEPVSSTSTELSPRNRKVTTDPASLEDPSDQNKKVARPFQRGRMDTPAGGIGKIIPRRITGTKVDNASTDFYNPGFVSGEAGIIDGGSKSDMESKAIIAKYKEELQRQAEISQATLERYRDEMQRSVIILQQEMAGIKNRLKQELDLIKSQNNANSERRQSNNDMAAEILQYTEQIRRLKEELNLAQISKAQTLPVIEERQSQSDEYSRQALEEAKHSLEIEVRNLRQELIAAQASPNSKVLEEYKQKLQTTQKEKEVLNTQLIETKEKFKRLLNSISQAKEHNKHKQRPPTQ